MILELLYVLEHILLFNEWLGFFGYYSLEMSVMSWSFSLAIQNPGAERAVFGGFNRSDFLIFFSGI
jgi:hypothetical protein